MKKYVIKITFILFVFSLFVLPISAAETSPLKVVVPKKTGSYMPGDSIEISWTPSFTTIQTITLIPAEKNKNLKGAVLYSDKVYGYPVITSGKFKYTFESYSIPSGSYYIGLSFPGSNTIAAQSSKKIKVENKPSLYFGTADGEVNSVSVSRGESVELKWEASSVKKCKASSFPSNSKWKSSVAASGTKTIRVSTPTTFYLNCKNNLGEVTSGLEVNTEAPERSTAKLIPSTTFIQYNFPLGMTQSEALTYNISANLFNSSDIQPIYYRIITDNQPSWINTGYTKSQIMLSPHGTAGIGAFADPSKVTQPGTYKWDLKLEGNFSNSPLVIPVTMIVTR